MVVVNRITYLRGLAQHGAKLTFSVSINGSTGIQKVKVVVDHSEHITMQVQYCTIGMLDWLLELSNTHHIADKGHRHSSGIPEVAFYISNQRFVHNLSMSSSNLCAEPVETVSAFHLNASSPFPRSTSFLQQWTLMWLLAVAGLSCR